MNKENIKWVDIDDNKKSELKFTPLNESKKEKVKVKDNRDYAFMLRTMLEGFIHTSRKYLVREDASSTEILKTAANVGKKKTDDRMNHKMFGRDEWREFERHVEIITQFMHIDDEKMNSMLEAMKKSFIALAELCPGGTWNADPTAALEQGFEKLQELDLIFEDAGITGLEPAIRASKFLDLLSPYQKEKVNDIGPNGEKLKTTHTQEVKMVDKNGKLLKEYDVKTFIQMLETRKGRKLAPKLKTGITYDLGKILSDSIKASNKNGGDLDINQTIEIFRKIVNQGGYSKNNAQVGKGEIALAMFFGDCSLPNKKGDISMNGKSVEVKGNSAGITERTTIQGEILNMQYSDALNLIKSAPKDELNTLLKKCKDVVGNEIDGGETKNLRQKLSETINKWKYILFNENSEVVAKHKKKNNPIEEEPPEEDGEIAAEARKKNNTQEWTWKHGLLFNLMFGLLSYTYFNTFDTMLILNTDDNLKSSNKESTLLNTKIIKLEKSKGGNWYTNGLDILKSIQQANAIVFYANRSNEGTFKVQFNT